jgi:hypothetical protein
VLLVVGFEECEAVPVRVFVLDAVGVDGPEGWGVELIDALQKDDTTHGHHYSWWYKLTV